MGEVILGAFQIIAAQVVCGDTNHGPASVGVPRPKWQRRFEMQPLFFWQWA
jgi:hypothetical protein